MKKYYFIVWFIYFLNLPLYAQTFPSHPIQLIIPMDAGSAGDIIVRPLAEEVSKVLGNPVIVVNKPGGSATIGANIVAKSKKDGYTLLYANTASVVYAKAQNPEQVSYEPFKDFEPLGLHCFVPLCIVVQENSPIKNFMEFVEYGKKNPGVLRISTIGIGSVSHLNLELIQSLTGAKFNVVPFKGGAAAITSLLGGHVDACIIANSLAIPHVKVGKLKMLLLTKKMSEFPDVPTFSELGYKQELLMVWFAFFAPSGIPEEVNKILVSAIEKAIKNPELKTKAEKTGVIVEYKSPNELKKLWMSDYEKASDLSLKLGLRK